MSSGQGKPGWTHSLFWWGLGSYFVIAAAGAEAGQLALSAFVCGFMASRVTCH